jgi:hypothetical protein
LDEERDKADAYNLNVNDYILDPVTRSAFGEIMATLNECLTVSERP